MDLPTLRQIILLSILLALCRIVCAAEPKNELSFYTNQTYVSDLKDFWHYYTVFYNRILDGKHKVGVQINHANRFNTTSTQYQLNGSAKLSDWITTNVSIAQAKKTQINYPNLQYMAEVYFALDGGLEVNLKQGGRIYSMFSNQKIYNYSGYVGYYFDNYFAWFQLDDYSVQAIKLYSFNLRKYFGDGDSFLSVNLNFGRTPDIGDVPPLDDMFIVKQRGASISGRYLLARSLYLYAGFAYTRLLYPFGLLRRLYDGTAGVLLKL